MARILSTLTAQTGISAAEYDWGQYAATVTISGIEEAKNNGEAQIIDLLEGKIFQTQETVIENMNTMFWADGTGNSNKDWNGLDLIVGKPNTSLGGIDPTGSGNSFWKSTETKPRWCPYHGWHGDPLQRPFRLVTTSRRSLLPRRLCTRSTRTLLDEPDSVHGYRCG